MCAQKATLNCVRLSFLDFPFSRPARVSGDYDRTEVRRTRDALEDAAALDVVSAGFHKWDLTTGIDTLLCVARPRA